MEPVSSGGNYEELTAHKTVEISRSSKKADAFSEEQLNEVTELLCTGLL